MNERYALSTALLLAASFAHAQCSVDLPSDSTTIYLGYEPLACTSLSPAVSGAQPTDLVWSNGSTAASIVVCDTASAWYFVTLTDDTVCIATDSVFVNVVDVRCGNNNNKVSVCHIPPGNPANAHTICISANGVPAHLAHGCRLGACEAEADSSGATSELELRISPNPMSSNASVTVHSRIQQRVRVSLVDALGRRSTVLLDTDLAADEQRTMAILPGDLPHGLRFCWVEAVGDNDRQVQRVVVLE